MPFLRAGLKNRPKPEPEEPKQEQEQEIVVVEPPVVVVAESEPVAGDVEPISESVPAVGDDIEPISESVPVAGDVEPISESVPVASDVEPISEVEPVVGDVEPISENEPVAGDDIEPISEVEPVVDSSGLPAEILEAVGESTAPQPESDSSSENSHADRDPNRFLLTSIEQDPTPPPSQDSQGNSSTTDYSGATLNYDFTSGERYVDKVSTKTEFDKMLDELANISKDLLSWQVEKFAKQHTGKFQGDFDKAESDAKKYEAFLGGYITNAAMTLYDNGYRDAAIKQLEQAKSILEARKKLEEETEATRTRVAANDDVVDLTDILGLFGD